MLNTFVASFKLKATYRTNAIIYSLKSLPLIKKLLPESLYANRGLKLFANVINGIIEFGSIFFGKLLYLLLMLILPLQLMGKLTGDSLLTVLFFLTIVGAIFNTQLFNPTKDKYYAIFLLRIDAWRYTITNYLYFLLKMLLGFAVIALIACAILKTDWLFALAMALFVIGVKSITSALMLRFSKTKNENKFSPLSFTAATVLLAAAYIPVYFGYTISVLTFYVLTALCIVLAVFSFRYIFGYKEYKKLCKVLFSQSSFIQLENKGGAQAIQDVYLEKLEFTQEQGSNKSGYAYFHDIFMKRHRRLLTKSAKRTTAICGILFVAILAVCFALPAYHEEINKMVLNYLPYFLFVMYLIKRGNTITQAMFMNCDHSMLSYRFYRQPKTILYLFAARLKTIVKINLLPASVIAVALPIILFVTGGTTNPINYVVLFVSIIAMSVFFSVHSMVLYYLLQPYNAAIEMKSALFSVVSGATYMICYMALSYKIPTLLFGTAVSAFCIIYILVALFFAYKLAPKTFKLRR